MCGLKNILKTRMCGHKNTYVRFNEKVIHIFKVIHTPTLIKNSSIFAAHFSPISVNNSVYKFD